MRSDRKKAIQEEMEQKKHQKKNGRANGFWKFVSIVYTLLAIAFATLVTWLDILPGKYYWPLIAVLGVAALFIVPVTFSKKGKRGRKVIAGTIGILLIAFFAVGTYYMADTLGFLDDITHVGGTETEDFVVVVENDAAYENIEDINGLVIGATTDSDLVYQTAKSQLLDAVTVEFDYDEGGAQSLLAKLPAKEYPAVFISSASYESLLNEDDSLQDSTRILYTVKVEVEEISSAKAVKVTDTSFNVFLSGADISGTNIGAKSRTDVNMLVSVNPLTNKVLITSIPRDLYITLPSKQSSDKLTHSSLYGIDETVSTVEQLLGTEVNYYVRVNYATITSLVDALDGIDVESEYEFSTSGMGELNGHHFVVGTNHLDGDAALAFCRERHSFLAGDLQRNKNQQAVMEAVLKKATSSSTILLKYSSILDAVKGNMETNMTTSEMTSLVKMQLKNMPEWDIDKYSIQGNSTMAYCYSLGANASVVMQDAASVEEAKAAIQDVILGVAAQGDESQEDVEE